MRYLNKIIFINSAAVPYAEVMLDGNIHFIGTQGVGKSTVLRAILYFYNADSRKLGIPKGPTVKSFADWYLPYANSYIIYEVARETGTYCVLAYKSQSRLCYRFIDTEYKSAYFVKETGDVHSNWEAIREKLDADRVNVSAMVNSYEQYRDILYGNFIGKKEFKKYALLEAKQYSNIYRTIQNVFLNTKLDATEIKQTIISSMEDEDISIDLDKYKHHLKNFETELKDIKSFRYPSVQKQAENARQMLSALRHISREQHLLAAQLNWRLNFIETERPIFSEKATQLSEAKHSTEQKRQHENQLFDKRKDKVKVEINQLSGKLKEAAKQKAYYNRINITELIKRVSANEEKKLELNSLQKEKAILTNNYSDISNKYSELIKEQQNQLAAYTVQKDTEKLSLDSEKLNVLTDLSSEYEKLIAKIEAEFESELNAKQNELDKRRQTEHELDKSIFALKHKPFNENEIKQVQTQLNEAEIGLKNERNSIESYKQQIVNLKTKWEFEKKDAEGNNTREEKACQNELDKLLNTKAILTDKIAKSKDSLYGWLSENKPKWETNIGKLISEDVLFKDGLSPKLATDSLTMYGIELNLNEIDSRVKTIDDYRFEIKQLDREIEEKRTEIRGLTDILEKELEKIQRRNLPKIKELKEKLRQAEYSCEQLNRSIEKDGLNKDSLIQKAAQDKQKAIELAQIKHDHAVALKQEAASVLNGYKAKLKKSKENKLREKTRRIKEIEHENKTQKAEIQQQITVKQADANLQISQLKTDRNLELNDKGADTKRLNQIETLINEAESELKYIDSKRNTVSDYNKDKRELFDKEKEFKNEIKLLDDKLRNLQAEFALVQQHFSDSLRQLTSKIEEIADTLSVFSKDEESHEKFIISTSYSAISEYLSNAKPAKNTKTVIQLTDEIKEHYYIGIERNDELKTSVDNFLSHFSEGNVLNFPSKLLSTEAYLKWAEDLSDFIEEGKINEFEKRTNERFASIISSVGKETTLLISKTGEIKKIINKINADFRQKNFVTAVNNIELDITESKNSAVVLLKEIKEFNDVNALNLGASNLFSDTNQDKKNEKAILLLKQLVKEMNSAKDTIIQLTDSFELTFRVEENGNDTGWVEKLTNVGSEGTDVLVKAMVNIMLLNVFKEGASRKFKDFRIHCMMDEIGKLHPNNVKGILKFANDRNILLINGSPTESTPLNYRHIYKMHKDGNKQTRIKRIISNPIIVT